MTFRVSPHAPGPPTGAGADAATTEVAARAASATVGGTDAYIWHDRALAWERLRTELAGELSISPMDVAALVELYRHGPLRLTELVAVLPIRPPGVTSLVDRLTTARYAVRQAASGDRRGVQVDLTPAGRHAAAWVLDQAARITAPPAAGGSAVSSPPGPRTPGPIATTGLSA